MSWLKSFLTKSQQVPNSEQILEHAIQLVREGQAVEAVTMMKHCVDQIREACGDPSLPYAVALGHYGTLICATGDYQQGAEWCRKAADACPQTDEGRKERLTCLMNVGQLLCHGGHADQAIPVLQSSLRERVEFYGTGHPGIAYGEQVLAEAMLAAGRYADGLEHAENAAAIFEAERHPEFPGTFALRAALASASGRTADDVWKGLADYPEAMVNETVESAYRLAELIPDRRGLSFLDQLSEWCNHYLPDATTLRLNILVTTSNLAHDRNDLEFVGNTADRLANLIEMLNDPEDRIQMRQGLAMSYSRCGRPIESVRHAYQQAASEADKYDLPLTAAGVARNWALFEAECEQTEEAERHFDHAIGLARKAGAEGQEQLGRSLIAKGIFLQHLGHPEQARPLLDEGTGLLPATHADAACGVLHQVALENGLNCSCNGGESLSQQSLSLLAQKFFEQSGLGDLLERVGFGDEGLEVHLKRAPAEEELERLQIAHSVFTNQLQTRTP